MKPRVYLDTSVFSAYYDRRLPERQRQTREFWLRRAGFDLATSELAREELMQVLDAVRRRRLLVMLRRVAVHPVTTAINELTQRYLAAGVFTAAMHNDAVHVAAAVLTQHDVLLSWNFKHLVNRRRRAEVNTLNVSWGLSTIEIVAPPEL
ncbi:MAG: PIN domain-containing protein [Deltaproteobacteria bacterium]|nr:PIN domain-containing protein [Deltaproteobacteria bacterium]